MTKKLPLPDKAARTTALTEIDRSFLVEAGAGSGKTSVMAGRVAVLLAQGVQPKNIAAITFTEFAASELRIRIERFVNQLAEGKIPPDVESAFPKGVSATQLENLGLARKALDQLLCTTIHGFAQALIKPYPAEAGIDPGAEIIDPAEGDLAFEEHYRAWLKDHLSGELDDDIVAELVVADEKRGLKLLREVAVFLRRNRDAGLADHAWSKTACEQFAAATQAFNAEIGRFGFQEGKTSAACQAFIAIAKALNDHGVAIDMPASRGLIGATLVDRDLACFTKTEGKRKLQGKGAWEQAAVAAGKRKADGTAAFNDCLDRYDSCHEAFAALVASIASTLLARIVDAMNGLLINWSDYKRAAALLDFDDLLYTAKELLASKEEVRQALAKRFRHVLVDEFQDTDPLQIELVWRLCGEGPGDGNPEPLARVLRPGALFLVGDPKQAIYRFRGADVNAYLDAREAIGKKALLEIVANFRSLGPILDFVNARFAKPLSFEAGQPGFTALAATRPAENDRLAVAALDIQVDGEKPAANVLRDAEAERVAELCTRLVGNLQVQDRDGTRACRLGDIALLAPVGTDLWRFEEALEQRGIPVSTQAGKGFFRRQEIQDLIALARTIADARDTLAFGALLRGPLVGLAEAELLDVSEALPVDPARPDRLPYLNLWTDPAHINHELARRVVTLLQSLAKRVRSTTPYMLLADAISLLDVRAQLRQRFRTSADRALANVDLFLETASAYDVRGLRALPRHIAKLSDNSWARLVDLDLNSLMPINPADLGEEMPAPPALAENSQTAAMFADEAKRIAETSTNIQWHRPSRHEADAPPPEQIAVFTNVEAIDADSTQTEVAGSATRGTMLHKLMEEVLNGETQDTKAALEQRATDLMAQLRLKPSSDAKTGMAPNELAATILRTLGLPEIVALRPRLTPEHTVLGTETNGTTETLLSGIADAVARDTHGKIDVVIDWKSDVEMNPSKLATYRLQLDDYRKQTGADRALLVMMTSGTILTA